MVNIDLVHAPVWSPIMPPHGIACLSSFLKEKGHFVRCLDLNVEIPLIYKIFKKMLSIPVDFEATIESLSYPFLISMFYDEGDHKNILKELIREKTLFENDSLDSYVDWILQNKLIKTIKKKINVWVNNILDDDPQIVGFSTLCTNFPLSLIIAREIKKERRDILTILGGPHAFWLNKKIMKFLPWIDLIVKGEGELAFLKIIRKLKNNSYPKQNIIFEPYLKDINDIPHPDFDDFDIEKYIYGAIPVSMSRGCINNCRFCHEKRFWKIYRFKQPERVVDEIEKNLEKYNLDSFFFCDSLINGNKILLEKYCDQIISKKIDIYWIAHAGIKNIDKKLLKKIKMSGCGCLLYGIESGSQKILNKMHKGINLKEIEKKLKLTMDQEIWPLTYWIIGFPGESIIDVEKTKHFIIKNKKNIGGAVFHSFILSRETPIYSNPQKYRISIKRNRLFKKIDYFLWSRNYTVENGITHREAVNQSIKCRKEINFDLGISLLFPLNRELYPLFYEEKISGKLKDKWYDTSNYNEILDQFL